MGDSPRCPVCRREGAIPAGSLPLAGRGGAVRTDVSECGHCHSFWRSPPAPADLAAHLSAAGYTRDERREAQEAFRRPLFMQVGRIAGPLRGRWPQSPALLDVGCAHGHLLEHFAAMGFSCTGVEPVDRLRSQLGARGIEVHARLEDLAPGRGYDLVTFLDSLYYFPVPGDALVHALGLLSPHGVVVVRIANRTPFLRLLRPLRGRPVFRRVFGDQLVALSHRGVLEMVHRAGARLQGVHFHEARVLRGIADRLLFQGLGAVAAATRLPVSPGIVYVISRS